MKGFRPDMTVEDTFSVIRPETSGVVGRVNMEMAIGKRKKAVEQADLPPGNLRSSMERKEEIPQRERFAFKTLFTDALLPEQERYCSVHPIDGDGLPCCLVGLRQPRGVPRQISYLDERGLWDRWIRKTELTCMSSEKWRQWGDQGTQVRPPFLRGEDLRILAVLCRRRDRLLPPDPGASSFSPPGMGRRGTPLLFFGINFYAGAAPANHEHWYGRKPLEEVF